MARPEGRAHLGHSLWWPSPHHSSTRYSGIQLGAWRVPWLHHGLRDHRCSGRRRGQLALRPNGNAPLLWLQHGRLLWPLVEGGKRRKAREPATDLLCELVPPRYRWPLLVAGIRRKQPCSEMGL